MSSRKAQKQGEGFGMLVGLVVLVLTVTWPLFAFHHHWTTTSVVNCANGDVEQVVSASGCVYNWNTGNYSGTQALTTTHSAISAVGWIAEVVWLAFLVWVAILLVRLNQKKQRQNAEIEAARFTQRETFSSMSPREFEEALATLCKRDGCRSVKVTGKAGDLGADVVALTPDGRRLVIQAKRYGPKTMVSGPDLQKFGGTARPLHHADVAVVATTSGFTKQASDLGRRLNILLFDEVKLAGWASGTGPSPWQRWSGNPVSD
jgi:restriction system protein